MKMVYGCEKPYVTSPCGNKKLISCLVTEVSTKNIVTVYDPWV